MNMGDVLSPQIRCSTWHTYRFHCYFTFCTRAYNIPFFLLEILWNCENSKTYRKLRTQVLFCRFTNGYSSSQSYVKTQSSFQMDRLALQKQWIFFFLLIQWFSHKNKLFNSKINISRYYLRFFLELSFLLAF